MPAELWTFDELVRAAEGAAEGRPSGGITGVSIDTRSLAAGELFVALKDARDGHDFVPAAFRAGAGAALVAQHYVTQEGDGALIRVDDPLRGLERIGRAARARLWGDAHVVAVTGSVGKTGTKEMLRACLALIGPTHAADKSFNNHWGVPLTLSRMPAATRFGVFEIGMNHPGEITPLAQLVRPDVAIITTVEPVHLQFFSSVVQIAEAKAEIFSGLEPGGYAILNRDNAHFAMLATRAREHGARVYSFGRSEGSDVRPVSWDIGSEGSHVTIEIGGKRISYHLASPGLHLAQNSLAVIGALHVLGADVALAAAALSGIRPPAGRGARAALDIPGGKILLIDESYNANPASMRAALAAMATVPRSEFGRRIAVLGDMLELGPQAAQMHADLKDAIDAAGVDLVFACGPNMAHLFERLSQTMQGAWGQTSDAVASALTGALRPGDVLMIKGSLGSRMAHLVEAVQAIAEQESAGHELARP